MAATFAHKNAAAAATTWKLHKSEDARSRAYKQVSRLQYPYDINTLNRKTNGAKKGKALRYPGPDDSHLSPCHNTRDKSGHTVETFSFILTEVEDEGDQCRQDGAELHFWEAFAKAKEDLFNGVQACFVETNYDANCRLAQEIAENIHERNRQQRTGGNPAKINMTLRASMQKLKQNIAQLKEGLLRASSSRRLYPFF
ncbi:hypothetical protein FQN60_012120 [Etheostoma spectabile]|uniref:Uncharacterized protein n=1 Tax=Etheostoma spectabile TaxID=54343 RepID=A0A5J5DNS0_9PERO|nr:hypothetical protein FQN60_012120 [Etheostoma spectabile]